MADSHFNLFIDDTGTKDYAPEYSTGTTQYFGFGGLLVTPDVAGVLDTEMKKLKCSAFGVEGVEIKANWLRRREERERRYVKPYGITHEQLAEFSDSLYDLLVSTDVSLLGCIVDKLAVQNQYAVPHYAPSIAYDCILQRAQMEMYDRTGRVHVTIDDMSGATPGGNQYKANLTRQHKRMRTHGSTLQNGMVFDRIEGQSFRDSRHDERLQLADLVAYSVYRQFVDHGDDWDAAGKSLHVYEYFGKLGPKFCRHADGTISGYGVVKFPKTSDNAWGIKNP